MGAEGWQFQQKNPESQVSGSRGPVIQESDSRLRTTSGPATQAGKAKPEVIPFRRRHECILNRAGEIFKRKTPNCIKTRISTFEPIELECYYEARLLRRRQSNPIPPTPSRASDAGSGTRLTEGL